MRLDDYKPQLFESQPFHFMENEFKDLTDLEKFDIIVKCFHSINDRTIGGLIHEDDFTKISLFLTKKHYKQ